MKQPPLTDRQLDILLDHVLTVHGRALYDAASTIRHDEDCCLVAQVWSNDLDIFASPRPTAAAQMRDWGYPDWITREIRTRHARKGYVWFVMTVDIGGQMAAHVTEIRPETN